MCDATVTNINITIYSTEDDFPTTIKNTWISVPYEVDEVHLQSMFRNIIKEDELEEITDGARIFVFSGNTVSCYVISYNRNKREIEACELTSQEIMDFMRYKAKLEMKTIDHMTGNTDTVKFDVIYADPIYCSEEIRYILKKAVKSKFFKPDTMDVTFKLKNGWKLSKSYSVGYKEKRGYKYIFGVPKPSEEFNLSAISLNYISNNVIGEFMVREKIEE